MKTFEYTIKDELGGAEEREVVHGGPFDGMSRRA